MPRLVCPTFPLAENRLCHVHITSPALWLCKPRSVNYSNAHKNTYTHTYTVYRGFPQGYHVPCSSLYVTAVFIVSSHFYLSEQQVDSDHCWLVAFMLQNKCGGDTHTEVRVTVSWFEWLEKIPSKTQQRGHMHLS